MTRQYEDTDTRRAQVAEAALRTIAEDGVAGFTTKAVAQRVGISEGTLFRHFVSKEQVVLEAISLLEREMEKGLVETGDDLRDLETFFRHRAAFVGAEASVGRLVFSPELLHLAGPKSSNRIKSWRAKNMDYLATKLSALHTSHKLQSKLGVGALKLFIQGLLLTFALQPSFETTKAQADLQPRINQAWSSILLLLDITSPQHSRS